LTLEAAPGAAFPATRGAEINYLEPDTLTGTEITSMDYAFLVEVVGKQP